jgi:hypothetical protein
MVPQNLEALGENRLFDCNGYEPLSAYGPDRIAFQTLSDVASTAGDEIATIDTVEITDVDVLVLVDINYQYLHQALRADDTPALVYIMREPPSVIGENTARRLHRLAPAFDAIFTWNPAIAGAGEKFFEYEIPQYLETAKPSGEQYPFEDKTLLTNVSSRKYSKHPDELYSAREEVLSHFDDEHPQSLSMYGQYWNQKPRPGDIYHHGVLSPRQYQSYEGLAASKAEVFRKHKFALCFENMTGIDGYLTEKIFDCFRAGTVPVYWGATDVDETVPQEAYIDYRSFGSPSSLYKYLSSMGKDAHRRIVKAGRQFVQSPPEKILPERYANHIYGNLPDEHTASPPRELRDVIADRAELERTEMGSPERGWTAYSRELIGRLVSRPSLYARHPDVIVNSLRNRVRD